MDVFEKEGSARMSPKAVELLEVPANNALMQNALLHGADVNNPMKPWELCSRIAGMILDEFFDQGDQEKALGVPVQMLNDRDKVNRPFSQIGFIEFLVAPLLFAFVKVAPAMEHCGVQMLDNIRQWQATWESENAELKEQEIKAVTDRIDSAICNFLSMGCHCRLHFRRSEQVSEQ